MKLYLPALLLLSLVGLNATAQVQFTNRNELLQNNDIHSAVPTGIADMNGDGLDDIVSLDNGRHLIIQYQTPDPARPFVFYQLPVFIDNNEQNDICIADFNNDGANDILTVGSYDRVKVLYSTPYTYGFNLTHIVVTPFFSQGASAGDFNQDGWVDVVMLNDNGLNYTLINDGTGNLVLQNLFDFVTVPPSDNSGNYGCVYTDFDMDGDLDFYIAKCRQGVNNPSDPRRINVLFVNDGQGQYTQDAARYGLANGRQTWTADFGDFDNDGDLDCFMTQHDVISELYENINNDTFINITASAGLDIGGIPLQGMFRDFDNDGYQDILVSGDRLDYYHNNGDKTFTKINPFGNVLFGTFALGDLNQDGFTDVYASRVIPFNNPDPLREDILFLNDKTDHHYLGLQLTDTAGNPSAIGAMAILYGPWGIQIREVRGGEQYGVSNAHAMIFGLGQNTTYDSLIIRWPDGTREFYPGLETDKTWAIRRGGCVHQPLAALPALEVLCQGDSVAISIQSTLEFLSWSNGAITDTIVVKDPGIFYATFLDENGCPVKSTPLEVSLDPDTIQPLIAMTGNTQLCKGDVVLLSLPAALSYTWSNGETTQEIMATESGEYFALLDGYCKVYSTDTITLSFLDPDDPVTTSDTFELDGQALLTATGDSIQWYADAGGLELIGTGPELLLENLTDTTTVYAENILSIEGLDYQAGPVNQQGSTKYNATFVNGGQLFDVHMPILLEQVTLYTDSAGLRQIQIFDDIDVFTYAQDVFVDSGTTVVNLNVELPVGSYTITTNTDVNNQEFGVNSPYLWRSTEGILYPYEVPGVMSITNSTLGGNFYYYFYDWKISTTDTYCASDLVPATAFPEIETSTHQSGSAIEEFILSPNPSKGWTSLITTIKASMQVEVFNANGRMQWSRQGLVANGGSVVLDDLTLFPGVYYVRVTAEGKSGMKKLVVL